MKAVNYSELRQKLKFNLDSVTDNDELLVVHRPKGRSIIMMPLSEYNSWLETFHLTSSEANRKRLAKSVKNINSKTGLEKHNLVL
jgi:antitoxin YefM